MPRHESPNHTVRSQFAAGAAICPSSEPSRGIRGSTPGSWQSRLPRHIPHGDSTKLLNTWRWYGPRGTRDTVSIPVP